MLYFPNNIYSREINISDFQECAERKYQIMLISLSKNIKYVYATD